MKELVSFLISPPFRFNEKAGSFLVVYEVNLFNDNQPFAFNCFAVDSYLKQINSTRQ